eukprot:COSAG02_NODE_216_length_28610_cov_57.176879_10_plen_425_part_00
MATGKRAEEQRPLSTVRANHSYEFRSQFLRLHRYRMWPPTGVGKLMTDPYCKNVSGGGVVNAVRCLSALSDFMPLYADCWANDLTLQYDTSTDTYHDQKGIETVANGSLDLVAWQLPGDPPSDCTGNPGFGVPEYKCFGAVLDAAGYERGVEYDSLGWDWRKAPGDWMQSGGYFSQLQQAIESMCARNGGKPVILVSFSMGGPVTAVFLNHFVSATWKQQHIYRWLSSSGVFGGVQESLIQQINYNGSTTIPTMSRDASLKMMQSWGSQNWMASTLAPNDVVVNVTGSRVQYLGKDVATLYRLINKNDLRTASSSSARYSSEVAPGVETYVFSGSGYPTPQTFEFSARPDGQPNLLDDASPPTAHCVDGDGTATMESLIGVPQRWAAQGVQKGKKVEIVALPNVAHGNDMSQEPVVRKFYHILI